MRSRTFLISPDPQTISTLIGGNTPTSSLTLQSTSGVGTTDSIVFKVGNNGGTEAMRVINSGNVGIGTTAPLESLDVNGAVVSRSGRVTGANAEGASYVSFMDIDSTIGARFGAASNGNNTRGIVFATLNAGVILNAVTILGGGNVGIGTTNPATHKFQVAGSIGPNVDNTAGQDLGTLTSRFANGYIVGLHSGASSMTQSVGAGDTLVCTHTTTSSIFTTSVGFGVQTSSTATNVNGITGYITMLTAAGATIKVAVLT